MYNINFHVVGCFKGTWGNDCADQCPEKCIDNHCYPQNGTCVWGCDPSHCLHNKCDIHTSVCTDGCVPGRAGQYCNKCKWLHFCFS